MIVGLIIAGYVIMALIAARRINYYIRDVEDDGIGPRPDRVESSLLALLSVIAGLLWPLAIPVAVVMWHPRETSHGLREKIARRDARIAELEREAGIL